MLPVQRNAIDFLYLYPCSLLEQVYSKLILLIFWSLRIYSHILNDSYNLLIFMHRRQLGLYTKLLLR